MSKQTMWLGAAALAIGGFLWWRSQQAASLTAQRAAALENQRRAAALAAQQESERAQRQRGGFDLGPFVSGATDFAGATAAFLGSSEFQEAMGGAADVATQLGAAGMEGVLEGLDSYMT